MANKIYTDMETEHLVQLISGNVIKEVAELIKPLVEGDVINRNPLLNYKKASKYLNLSVSTLQHMVSRNEIPFIRIGGSIRFEKSDLDAFIYANKFQKK